MSNGSAASSVVPAVQCGARERRQRRQFDASSSSGTSPACSSRVGQTLPWGSLPHQHPAFAKWNRPGLPNVPHNFTSSLYLLRFSPFEVDSLIKVELNILLRK